mmetsp:Transcript_91663/g.158965  ORF Transcript_91663/g.158965 Transcript_91663/m.158965 type:complete len:152 (-) Transcript_91663:6-461(-)
MPDPILRPAVEDDLIAILDIYNHAVLNTTAIWNSAPVDLADRQAWFLGRQQANFPILVATIEGCCVGFATFGAFRPHEGFRLTVEHSVYVAAHAQRQGLGSLLLTALEREAQAVGKHVMVACIEAQNSASIELHKKHGFRQSGALSSCLIV